MEAINYLLGFFFDALLMVLVIRVWLQLVRADFYNPLSQFVVKVTNPIVIPFRRVIPGFGGVDLVTLFIAYVLGCAKFIVIPLLNGANFDLISGMVLGLLHLVKQTGFLMFILMLIMAVMSWVAQGYNPMLMVLHQLTNPLLKPIRRVIPPIGGLDLSLLAAFLILNVINILLDGWIPFWRLI